jgi:hypothetical protein
VTDSQRIPGGIQTEQVPESAFNTASQPASHIPTSSRSVALAATRTNDDLATVILSLRTDWKFSEILRAIDADDRPWRTVVAASIRGALLDGPDTIRHPNGLRYVNPTGTDTTPPLPTVDEALNPQLCHHDFRAGACPLCRRAGAA